LNDDQHRVQVLVVDDEPLVRIGVTKILRTQSKVELVGEASNGLEAVSMIEELAPDIVFLDVQMPGLDGFEVLDALEVDSPPVVVFVTAYDQHAIKAFDVHAVDYILKPFDDERLLTALDRAVARLNSDGKEKGIESLLGEVRSPKGHTERFLVRSAGRIYFVAAEEVDWIDAADNYVRLHAGGKPHLIRSKISQLAEELDPSTFVRVHRSHIVNMKQVKELKPLPSGDCDVVLKNDVVVRLSRSYRQDFESRMTG
jgi:two-component system LytT family response regulator